MAGKYDELLERLQDEFGVDEDVLEGLKGSSLRKQLQDAEKRAQKAEELERKLGSIERAPKRRQVFEELGVDFDSLRPAERKLVEGFDWDGDAPDKEKVAQFISEFDLPTSQEEEESEEAPEAATIAAHAKSSRHSSTQARLTPEEVSNWSTERILRLREKNPDAFDQLKRGESVTGVAV